MSFYLACVATDEGQNQLGSAKGQEKLRGWTEFRAWLNNMISEVNTQLGNRCLSWASQNTLLVLAVLEKPTQRGLWPHPSPDAVIARIWTCCCHRSWWKHLARSEGMGGLNRGKWIKSSVSSKKMVTSQIVFKNYFHFSSQRLPQISLKSPAEGEWFKIMLSGNKSIGFSKAAQRGPACHEKILIKTKQPLSDWCLQNRNKAKRELREQI